MDTEQKRVFAAVALSGLVLFIWQAYFAPERQPTVGSQQVESSNVVEQSIVAEKSVGEERGIGVRDDIVGSTTLKQSFVTLRTESGSFSLSNYAHIGDAKSQDSFYSFREVLGFDGDSAFFVEIVTRDRAVPIPLTFSKQEDRSGIRGSNSQYGINLTAYIAEKGRLKIRFESDRRYRYRITFKSKEKEVGYGKRRDFILFGKEIERYAVGDKESGSGHLVWFGVDFSYHLFIFSNSGGNTFRYSTTESGNMIVETVDEVPVFEGSLVFTKKNYDTLTDLGDNLHLSVDFGIFGIVAVPILRGLQFLYKYLGNYGLAIIVLTFFIRLITFPLQYKSFKSMKRMQKIQPELAKLKEKYKDDAQRMQKETMELFKRAGANPLGGCFPMLLQMPIFFAFYQVLYNAVELVEAPFYFWIIDLSDKDPYYVLPVLMTITMFVQSKLTPSATIDPTQKKIMYIMPLVFGFIMKDLPSGLNLYMTVSILLGSIQQILVYKSTTD